MTTDELLAELDARGVILTAMGEKLLVEAPEGSLTEDLRRIMAERKPALMLHLGAVIHIPLDDLVTGDYLARHHLRIVGGQSRPPRLHLDDVSPEVEA
jgi:hypothetical protein